MPAWYDFLGLKGGAGAGGGVAPAATGMGSDFMSQFGWKDRLVAGLEGFSAGLRGESGASAGRNYLRGVVADEYLEDQLKRSAGGITPVDLLQASVRARSGARGKVHRKHLPGGMTQDYYETPSGELRPWGEAYERTPSQSTRPRHMGGGWWQDHDAQGNPVGEPYQMKPGSMPPWWMMFGGGGPWGMPGAATGAPSETGAAPPTGAPWEGWGDRVRSWLDGWLEPDEPSPREKGAEARLNERY